MNILAPTTTTRQLEFVVAALAADITAYQLGVLDAERGEIACPEMYFTKSGDKCEYCEGYEAVKGATLTTRQFLGNAVKVTAGDIEATINGILAPVAVDDSQLALALDLIDYEAEAADLVEARLDEQYHASGAW